MINVFMNATVHPDRISIGIRFNLSRKSGPYAKMASRVYAKETVGDTTTAYLMAILSVVRTHKETITFVVGHAGPVSTITTVPQTHLKMFNEIAALAGARMAVILSKNEFAPSFCNLSAAEISECMESAKEFGIMFKDVLSQPEWIA
jgi:hypothetical protein